MSGSTKFITNPTVRCQSFVLEYHSISSPIWKPSRYIKLDQPNTDDDANATATTSNDTFHEFLHPTVTPRIQLSVRLSLPICDICVRCICLRCNHVGCICIRCLRRQGSYWLSVWVMGPERPKDTKDEV